MSPPQNAAPSQADSVIVQGAVVASPIPRPHAPLPHGLDGETWGDFASNALECLHQVDADGRIVWVNQSELDFMGYSRDEYLGQDVRRFHVDPDVVSGMFDRLRRGVPVLNQRARLRRKDGTVRTVLISSNARLDPSGRLHRSRCFTRDITDLVLAEQAHQATERLLAQRERQQSTIARLGSKALSGMELPDLFDLAVSAVGVTLDVHHVGLAQLQPDGTFSFHAGIGWKAGLVGQAGLSASSQASYALGTREPVVFADLAQETRFEGSAILQEAGIVSGMTVPIPGGDRPWGILGAHSTVPRTFTRDDVNFLEAVAQILANGIGRKRTEAALAARVRQQAAVARLGHEALVRDLPELLALAAQEVAVALQADFCKVLELDRDGLLLVLRAGVGWSPGKVGHATVPADTHSQAGFALRNDRAVIVDDLATETRFEPAPLLLEHGVVSGMSVIIRGRGRPYGVVGVHSLQRRHFSEDDVAFLEAAAALLGAAVERFRVHEELQRHRAHLEEEVVERTRQLAASNKELEAFSYSVSHDLRAPLRTITGFSTLLAAKHGERLGGEALELVDGVRKNAERLGRLIDELLDLSRVQRVDLVRDRIDLSALARRTLANLAVADPGRTVACSVQPGLEVKGDRRLLRILMENLLANAWKFTRRTQDAAITVGRQGTNGGSVYFVKDNGAGLDMAYAGKLFQPFQRLHRPSEFEGTGIGLATVKRIIERHGGRVWLEGRPGAGAAVYFTLGSGKAHP